MNLSRLCLAAALALSGCATYGSITRDKELFQELGGITGIGEIVDELLALSLADARILQVFADRDIPHIKKAVTEQLCSLTGGPCVYKGKDMAATHKGLNISAGEFNAFAEDLQKAMNHRHVPLSAQNKLLAILAAMRRDIVGK